jgi:hypothetical protein
MAMRCLSTQVTGPSRLLAPPQVEGRAEPAAGGDIAADIPARHRVQAAFDQLTTAI